MGTYRQVVTLWLSFCALFLIANAQDFYDTSCPTVQKKMCANLGGGSDSIDEFRGDKPYVTYMNLGGSPRAITTKNCRIKSTKSPLAFVKQMSHPRAVSFFFEVDSGYKYDIELGFAHISSCKGPGTDLKIEAQGLTSPKFNVLKDAGCRKAHFVKLTNLNPSPWNSPRKGKITISVVKETGSGPAAVATLCVTQTGTSDLPKCAQNTCITHSGNYGYANAYGHGCKNVEGFAVLDVPDNARIVKSYITWGALHGDVGLVLNITINDEVVLPDYQYGNPAVAIYSADITQLVRKAGFSRTYKITNFNSYRCDDTVWRIAVIYQLDNLPVSNINLCGTPQIGNSVSFGVQCIHPGTITRAQLHIHFLETYGPNTVRLFINSEMVAENFLSENVGWGSTYVSFDVSSILKDAKKPQLLITKTGGSGREVMAIIDVIETI